MLTRHFFIHDIIAGRGIYGAYFGQGVGPIVLDNVNCNGMEVRLLDCPHRRLSMHDGNCDHSKDISIGCVLREDQRVKNITLSVEIINTPSNVHTAVISWVLHKTTMDEPNSFDVTCFDEFEQHSITKSVSGQNFITYLAGLLPTTSYNCCVSAVYQLYIADGICTEIETPELFVNYCTCSSNEIPKLCDSRASIYIVGGVFGFVIVILLILLTISGVVLVYLQLGWKRSVISAR